MYTVFIEGLEFYGYHGVPAEEKVIGHRYIADVFMSVDGEADTTDEIADTVDYGDVGQAVMDAVSSKKAHTLEHLARLVCEELLKRFKQVSEVTIRLGKPHPPSPMIAAVAGVEITVAR